MGIDGIEDSPAFQSLSAMTFQIHVDTDGSVSDELDAFLV